MAGRSCPLPVLRLPTEILCNILGLVETSSHHEGGERRAKHNSKDIRSCRLTCRRFCEISSTRLVRLIHVDYRLSSLERLQDVSRHPVISRGVLAVRLSLGRFEKPGDFGSFVQKLTAARQVPDPYSERMTDGEQEALKIHDSWRRIGRKNSPRIEIKRDQIHRARLRTLYEEYQRLYEDQEALRAQGGFAEAIGAAFARMPFAKELHYQDVGAPRSWVEIWEPEDADQEMYGCALDITQQKRDGEIPETPPYSFINVSIAVHNAGVALQHVKIHLNSDFAAKSLVVVKEARSNFISAMGSVQSFSAGCGHLYCDDIDEESTSAVLRQWWKCMPALRRLDWNLLNMGWNNATSLNLSESIPWTDIRISGGYFDALELWQFLRQLPSTPNSVIFSNVLFFGTCGAQFLDTLRDKAPRHVQFDDLSWLHSQTKELMAMALEKQREGQSEAERYVLRLDDTNPLVAAAERQAAASQA
ncbi:hypothetical protein QBC34DRAFT_458990 [Podospora aff. communis PSN243]|uniref:F-box domain-containing protein n=1 Tax=Podospora aff. communis PSN243 TaxID=3040156 RepID=A0AAV9GRM7_9PEZI|nr:hypothetical protein QBC34DRAFT_458990 [Podospora aff. communis PSN243]